MRDGLWKNVIGIMVTALVGGVIIGFMVGAMYAVSQLISAMNLGL